MQRILQLLLYAAFIACWQIPALAQSLFPSPAASFSQHFSADLKARLTVGIDEETRAFAEDFEEKLFRDLGRTGIDLIKQMERSATNVATTIADELPCTLYAAHLDKSFVRVFEDHFPAEGMRINLNTRLDRSQDDPPKLVTEAYADAIYIVGHAFCEANGTKKAHDILNVDHGSEIKMYADRLAQVAAGSNAWFRLEQLGICRSVRECAEKYQPFIKEEISQQTELDRRNSGVIDYLRMEDYPGTHPNESPFELYDGYIQQLYQVDQRISFTRFRRIAAENAVTVPSSFKEKVLRDWRFVSKFKVLGKNRDVCKRNRALDKDIRELRRTYNSIRASYPHLARSVKQAQRDTKYVLTQTARISKVCKGS